MKGSIIVNDNVKGNLIALFTVMIWGTTFITTKILLDVFAPVEILFTRFLMGLAALYIACPKILKGLGFKKELMLAAAGLCGVTLYYLMENIALSLSYASNVGVLVSISPCITAIGSYLFLKSEKLKAEFFIGFALAITGIALISFNGAENLGLNPKGDILAVCACFVWSAYSILTKKIGEWNINNVLITRRLFLYGTIFMIPFMIYFGGSLKAELIFNMKYLPSLIYLGVGASAMCFATWNYALKLLGAVKTSIYIYLIPVITVVMSYFVLGETITPMAMGGTLLTLLGLIISEGRIQIFHGKKAVQ